MPFFCLLNKHSTDRKQNYCNTLNKLRDDAHTHHMPAAAAIKYYIRKQKQQSSALAFIAQQANKAGWRCGKQNAENDHIQKCDTHLHWFLIWLKARSIMLKKHQSIFLDHCQFASPRPKIWTSIHFYTGFKSKQSSNIDFFSLKIFAFTETVFISKWNKRRVLASFTYLDFSWLLNNCPSILHLLAQLQLCPTVRMGILFVFLM